MNLFGIGNMEIAFVLIVAGVVLGPARVVDLARNAGTFYRKARRTIREIADTATVKLDEEPAPQTVRRDPVPGPEGAVSRGSDEGAGKVE
jgi:Sec-independent protein translocase protein TatA